MKFSKIAMITFLTTISFMAIAKKPRTRPTRASRPIVRSFIDTKSFMCYSWSTRLTKLGSEYYTRAELKKEFYAHIKKLHQKDFKSGLFRYVPNCDRFYTIAKCIMTVKEKADKDGYEFGERAVIKFMAGKQADIKAECMKKRSKKISVKYIRIR